MLIKKQSWILGSQYSGIIPSLNFSHLFLPPLFGLFLDQQGRQAEEAGQELGAIPELSWNYSSHLFYFMGLLWINIHFNLKPVQIKSQRKKEESSWWRSQSEKGPQ